MTQLSTVLGHYEDGLTLVRTALYGLPRMPAASRDPTCWAWNRAHTPSSARKRPLTPTAQPRPASRSGTKHPGWAIDQTSRPLRNTGDTVPWQPRPGTLTDITAATDGTVYGVSSCA